MVVFKNFWIIVIKETGTRLMTWCTILSPQWLHTNLNLGGSDGNPDLRVETSLTWRMQLVCKPQHSIPEINHFKFQPGFFSWGWNAVLSSHSHWRCLVRIAVTVLWCVSFSPWATLIYPARQRVELKECRFECLKLWFNFLIGNQLQSNPKSLQN